MEDFDRLFRRFQAREELADIYSQKLDEIEKNTELTIKEKYKQDKAIYKEFKKKMNLIDKLFK